LVYSIIFTYKIPKNAKRAFKKMLFFVTLLPVIEVIPNAFLGKVRLYQGKTILILKLLKKTAFEEVI